MSTDELPIVVRVVEGDAPLDVDAKTIGHVNLRRGDAIQREGDDASEWRPVASRPPYFVGQMYGGKVTRAVVQPRPAPELAVGAGVERTVDACPQVGWVLSLHDERVVVEDAYSGQRSVWRRKQVNRVVPTIQMPKYRPPDGIESDLPPEVATEFKINGVRWRLEDGKYWKHGAHIIGSMSHEQTAWLIRALSAMRAGT